MACVFFRPFSLLSLCRTSKSVGLRSVPRPPFFLPYQPVVAVIYMLSLSFDTEPIFLVDGLAYKVLFISIVGLCLFVTGIGIGAIFSIWVAINFSFSVILLTWLVFFKYLKLLVWVFIEGVSTILTKPTLS